jgi:hypothetical protein
MVSKVIMSYKKRGWHPEYHWVSHVFYLEEENVLSRAVVSVL